MDPPTVYTNADYSQFEGSQDSIEEATTIICNVCGWYVFEASYLHCAACDYDVCEHCPKTPHEHEMARVGEVMATGTDRWLVDRMARLVAQALQARGHEVIYYDSIEGPNQKRDFPPHKAWHTTTLLLEGISFYPDDLRSLNNYINSTIFDTPSFTVSLRDDGRVDVEFH